MNTVAFTGTHPRGRTPAAGFALSLLLLAAVRLPAADAPSRDLRETDRERPAYVAVVLADQARADGDRQRAIQKYEEAMQAFMAIQHKYPGYKTEAIRFRLDYCQEQLAALMNGPASTPAAGAAAGAAPAGSAAEDARTRAEEMVRKIREERERALAAARPAATPPSAPTTPAPTATAPAAPDTGDADAARTLRAERRTWERTLAGLVDATNEAFHARGEAELKVQQLSTRVDELETELRTLRRVAGDSTNRLGAAESAAASHAQRADEARQTIEALRAAQAALARKCEELEKDRDACKTRLAKTSDQLIAVARTTTDGEVQMAALRKELREAAAERDRAHRELETLRNQPPPAHAVAAPAADGAAAGDQVRLLERALEDRNRENLELKAMVGRLQEERAAEGPVRLRTSDPDDAGAASDPVRAERDRLTRLFADEREALKMAQKVLEEQVAAMQNDLRVAARETVAARHEAERNAKAKTAAEERTAGLENDRQIAEQRAMLAERKAAEADKRAGNGDAAERIASLEQQKSALGDKVAALETRLAEVQKAAGDEAGKAAESVKDLERRLAKASRGESDDTAAVKRELSETQSLLEVSRGEASRLEKRVTELARELDSVRMSSSALAESEKALRDRVDAAEKDKAAAEKARKVAEKAAADALKKLESAKRKTSEPRKDADEAGTPPPAAPDAPAPSGRDE